MTRECNKELEKLLYREKNAKQICAELNNFVDLKSTLLTILQHIQKLSGSEAVGIRLEDDGNYPYYVYNGFPDSFIKKENDLCAKDKQNKRIREPGTDRYYLDCWCGRIIRGIVIPGLSCFTPGGSLWSNNTAELLSLKTDDGKPVFYRNFCIFSGYKSLALIPIKAKGDIIGLIQLNDMRTGLFTLDFIEFMEMIGEQIGLAVKNSLIYSKLKNAMDEIKILETMLPICSKCKKIRDEKTNTWRHVEEYFREYTKADFSHSLCPDCVSALYPGLE